MWLVLAPAAWIGWRAGEEWQHPWTGMALAIAAILLIDALYDLSKKDKTGS